MTGELFLLLTWLVCVVLLVLFLMGCSRRHHPEENRYLDEDERIDQLNEAWRKKRTEVKKSC